MTHNLRVDVDRMVCAGAGDCVRIAPAAFRLDEEQIAVVVADASSIDEETLRTAERECPSGAIVVRAEP
jgi:ferredoxin